MARSSQGSTGLVDGPIVRIATSFDKCSARIAARQVRLSGSTAVSVCQPSIRSTTVAIPCPTPMHIVARPNRPPVRRSSWVSIVIRRLPLIPSG